MKLNLKEFQALDAMLYAYSISNHKSYKLIFKLDYKIVSANFFQFIESYEFPIENDITFNGDMKPKYIENQDSYFYSCCLKLFYNRLENRYDSLNRIGKYPDLLLNEFLKILNENNESNLQSYKTNKIHNVHFLESNLKFDFYLIDPDEEYELVSLILESGN